MTDQIELPPVPQSPPIIRLLGYGDEAPDIIIFKRDEQNELIVNLDVRDEDLTETLSMRWRIVSNTRPPGAPAKEYPCPEPEILGDGQLVRKATLKVQADSFARGTCNRVDVIVSASFKKCRPDRDDDGWDITTQEDDEADIGRLSFWVWATDASGDPRLQPETALTLTRSCQALPYQSPSATATEASAATTGM